MRIRRYYIDSLERVLQELEHFREIASLNGKFNAAAAFEKSKEIVKQCLFDEGWIPCSQQMPDKGEKVLCYFKYEPESTDVVCENVYIGSGIWKSETEKVVAWRTLPEPYRKDGE